MTALKTGLFCGAGVGDGLGAALHGSGSSYTEVARGFSSTKLPTPKPLDVAPTYRWPIRGELNIVARSKPDCAAGCRRLASFRGGCGDTRGHLTNLSQCLETKAQWIDRLAFAAQCQKVIVFVVRMSVLMTSRHQSYRNHKYQPVSGGATISTKNSTLSR